MESHLELIVGLDFADSTQATHLTQLLQFANLRVGGIQEADVI